jgi:hypothetical protein
MHHKFALFAGSLLFWGALMPPGASAAENELNPHAWSGQADGHGNYSLFHGPRADASWADAAAGAAGAVTAGNGINYHNGPVLQGTVNIYYILYGNWASSQAGANAATILADFARSIGGSPYFNINTTYGDTTGNVSGNVAFAGSISDSGSLGTALTSANIQSLVSGALSTGKLPTDTNGVYFVLTAPGVTLPGFLTSFCGWHTYATLNGANIKYSFVGNATGPSFGACAVQGTSPNGNPGVDAMISVIAHELEETTSDPNLNAWWDANGAENADKCAWRFGTYYAAAGGGFANMKLGTRDFLIQQNWVNAGGGKCALSYNSTPDFSISVSPTSQSLPVAGGTTGKYTITAAAVNGFNTSGITYTVTGLPGGATASAVASGGFTVTASAGLAAGTYPFTITGTSGSLTHTASATLVKIGDFSLALSPASQTVAYTGGTTGNYTITATGTAGFNTSSIGYSLSGVPSGATVSPLTNNAFTVTAPAGVAAGSYTLTLTGTSGSLVHTATAILVKTAAPNFSLSVSPASQSLPPTGGTTGSYTITATGTNGFNTSGIVYTVTGLPTGAGASAIASGGFTVTASASLAGGTYPFTITGTSGTLVHTAAASLVKSSAPDFTIAVSPLIQNVTSIGGTTGKYTITATALNGFNTSGIVYTVSSLPKGATASAVTNGGFTVATTSSLVAGTHPFTITATSGSLVHTTTAYVGSMPDFTVVVSPASQTVAAGGGTTGKYTITPTALNGFTTSGIVYTVTGLPSGATASAITSGGFTVTATAGLAAGSYPFTITGTSGTLIHTATATLVKSP